jgi:hypothetical protein
VPLLLNNYDTSDGKSMSLSMSASCVVQFHFAWAVASISLNGVKAYSHITACDAQWVPLCHPIYTAAHVMFSECFALGSTPCMQAAQHSSGSPSQTNNNHQHHRLVLPPRPKLPRLNLSTTSP